MYIKIDRYVEKREDIVMTDTVSGRGTQFE